jgi:general secretion pathway protein B
MLHHYLVALAPREENAMSYILDALKKAEREREIKQVPTLMAAHLPGTKHSRRPWVVLGALAICAGAAIWLLLLLQRTMNSPKPSVTAGEYNPAPKGLESSPSRTTASSAMSAKPEIPSEKAAGPETVAPRAIIPAVPRNLPVAKTVDSERRQQMAEWMAAAARQREDDSEDNPPPEMMDGIQPRLRTPERTPKAEMSAAEAPRDKPATLKEALNEMTLSILLYDEDKAGRMVFINGIKYVEGDLVESTYLLENITMEGAVLSYRGERALLRPKAK